MPPIPALPALPANAAIEMPAFIASGSASRFTDALMALLAPESAPTLSLEDARTLGWGELLKPIKGAFESLETVVAETASAEEPIATPEAFAMLGLPGLVINFASLDAAPKGLSASPGAGLEAIRLGGMPAGAATIENAAPELRAELPELREVAPMEFVEAQRIVEAAQVQEAPAKLTMDAPLGSSAFRDQTAESLRWMVRHGETHAEIRIEPPDLGPIQIELKIAREGTEVVFVAAHPDTRDALQDQIPELRDLLAESGIQLSNASVRDESGSPGTFEGGNGGGDEKAVESTTLVHVPAANRLIDTFA